MLNLSRGIKNKQARHISLDKKIVFLLFIIVYLPQCVVAQITDMLRYKDFLFLSRPVPESVKTKMLNKSIPNYATVDFEELRYLTVFYYDYEGDIKKGELVCNKAIAHDLLCIFRA